jgi:hypothetical protein
MGIDIIGVQYYSYLHDLEYLDYSCAIHVPLSQVT